ncbi:hypothetical protein Taro_026707 [Colocasia esculenta]|uniref:Secreted protein n=1 Tax=Colocasia esculenta TaxID=4460 RepID=A0A843VPE4_COLES|nr:hypothetical protein [Colocasia esculenta]
MLLGVVKVVANLLVGAVVVVDVDAAVVPSAKYVLSPDNTTHMNARSAIFQRPASMAGRKRRRRSEERVGGLCLSRTLHSPETEDEYIEILVSRERSSFESHGSAGFSHSDASTTVAAGDWLKCMRFGAVQWILKTRTYFGFSHHTAYLYLSVIYLD